MRDGNDRIHYRGDFNKYESTYLPHWDVEDGIYFVTFRLHDSIPGKQWAELAENYSEQVQRLAHFEDADPGELAEFAFEYYLEHVDPELDRAHGPTYLRRDDVAEMVSDSLAYFDGERYDLEAWVVMPNHVHVVFQRRSDWELAEVVGGWKSYTAHRAREFVEFGDHFWQRGYFDRLIRTKTELRDTIQYVRQNPESAGLERWEWRG